MTSRTEAALRQLYEKVREEQQEKLELWGELLDVTGKAKEYPKNLQLFSRELEGWTEALTFVGEEILELLEQLPKEDPEEAPTSPGQVRPKGAMH